MGVPLSLCKFYTKPNVARLLIQQIGDVTPTLIVDVGAGQGALSIAARERWAEASILTLDVDPESLHHLDGVFGPSDAAHHHMNIDMLNESAVREVKSAHPIARDGADVTLCNPPYLPDVTLANGREIIGRGGFLLSAELSHSPDVAFVSQSIELTRMGGTVALILSDSLVSAERYQAFRAAMFASHRVASVVQLPRRSFVGTEAQAYLVVLRKGAGPTRYVEASRFDGTNKIGARTLAADEMMRRWDFAFHSMDNGHRAVVTLADIGATVTRGRLTSSNARISRAFHIAHFPSVPGSAVSVETFGGTDASAGLPTIEKGDIVIARVGRNLHHKVAVVSAGKAPITDCVYRIRVGEMYRDAVLKSLASEAGAMALLGHARGVGALSLSKASLLSIPLLLGAEFDGQEGWR